MELVDVLEKLGIPVATAAVFGLFIWRQNKWIQEELQKEMRESFQRLEKITIDLINAQKNHSVDLKSMQSSYKSIVDIIRKLSGNGLKK